MDLLESPRFFVLLFWYVDERNWTVQSTSTIIKPRKEGYEYKIGDIVIAKFQGKPYKAVILRVEDEKEKLNDDKAKFDTFLQDASLSPQQLLVKMGVHAKLDASDNETTPKPSTSTSSSTTTSKSTTKKRPLSNAAQPKKKEKTESAKDNSKTSKVKEEEKVKKEAAVESAKVMAARLLQNKSKISKSCTFETNSSASTPMVNHPQDLEQTHFTFSTEQAPEPLQHNYFSAYNAVDDYDWNYYGGNYPNSASEFFAQSLTNATNSEPTNAMSVVDCSNCYPMINALEQRVKCLEDKLEAQTSYPKPPLCTPPKPPLSHSFQVTSTSRQTNAPIPSSNQSLMLPLETSATCENIPKPATLKESSMSCSKGEVDLVGGYPGVRISVEQLDVCLRKAKGSGTALARLLCNVFFTEDVLSRSSARGSRNKPSLDTSIVNAIISSKNGKVLAVHMWPCGSVSCILYPGATYGIKIEFTPYEDSAKATTKLIANIYGKTIYLPVKNACKFMRCPVKKGQTETLEVKMRISFDFPRVLKMVKFSPCTCGSVSCILYPGATYGIKIEFTPYEDSAKATTKLIANIYGKTIYLPVKNACKFMRCPVKKGQTETLEVKMRISFDFPRTKLQLLWEVLDEHKANIFCIELNLEIKDPRNMLKPHSLTNGPLSFLDTQMTKSELIQIKYISGDNSTTY